MVYVYGVIASKQNMFNNLQNCGKFKYIDNCTNLKYGEIIIKLNLHNKIINYKKKPKRL